MTSITHDGDRIKAVLTTTELPRYNPWTGISVAPISGDEHGLDGFSLILAETEPGGEVPIHSHSYQEVFIVREGRGRWTVGDEEHDAGPGDIVIAPANTPHSVINEGAVVMRHTSIQLTGTLGDAFHRRSLSNMLDWAAEIEG